MVARKRQRDSSPPPYTKEAPPVKKRAPVEKQAAKPEGVHKIIVGVDFGTTYTGKS